MKAARLFLNIANTILTIGLTLCMLLVMLYSGYALWDNNRVYAETMNIQSELLSMKPVPEEEDSRQLPDFRELLSRNSDVCAWVEIDNTRIDYPVMQGESNLTYINRDYYGDFSLSGSIFLDARNHMDLSDPYSLLYGHHMEKSNMFGDLDLFLERDFFEQNRGGTLLLPNGVYDLAIFAVLQVPASEGMIFDPQEYTEESIGALLEYAEENALFFDKDVISQTADQIKGVRILGLSTCSTEFTDARTVVLAVMQPISGKQEDNE